MADVVSGGGVDGCGTGPGREVALVGEAGDVPDLDEQLGGPGGSDAVQVGQGGAGLAQQGGELLVRGLPPLVEPLEVSHQLGRDPFPGLAHHVAGAHTGENLAGLGGGEVALGASGNELQQ